MSSRRSCPAAVLDACVLYPAPLRDLLLQLALNDLYRARWTDQIHAEWIRNVLANRSDLRVEQLERTRELMNSHVRDCLVTGYEPLVETLSLPDAGDRHVLAAAIYSHSTKIITFNLKDFPSRKLAGYGIKAVHPDEFIAGLIENNGDEVLQAVAKCRQRLKNPPKSSDEYIGILSGNRLEATCRFLAGNKNNI